MPIFLLPGFAAEPNSDENAMIQKLLEFHTKLARQGNLESIVKLGVMYEKGEGVAKDRNKAIELYKMAADRGYQPAQELLDNIMSNKSNVNEHTNVLDTIKVPTQRNTTSNKLTEDQQEELRIKLEQEKTAAAAARAELERLRQEQLVEQEKQRHMLEEMEKVQKAQEELAQERAKAEAARLELEQLRKQQEQDLLKQQQLAKKQQLDTKEEKDKQKDGQKEQTGDAEKTTFSSDPCNTPAARFMSTCN